MKLKWSELKAIAMNAFAQFKADKNLTAQMVADQLYLRYRTTLPKREPVGAAAEAFRHSISTWDEQARAFARVPERILPKLNPTQAARVKRDNIARESAKLRTLSTDEEESDTEMDYDDEALSRVQLDWIIRPPQPRYLFETKFQFMKGQEVVQEDTVPVGTKINAILCYVDKAPRSLSRLSLVVHPQYTGQPLLRKLHILALALKHVGSSSSSAICDFKVMSPELGSEGPESAVIYLLRPLHDGSVKLLIMELSAFLAEDLMDLNACPFGLIKLEKGIYGADIPGSIIEKDVFGYTCSSSAGSLIAAIISRAGWDAAQDLYHGDRVDKNREERLRRLRRTKDERLTWNQAEKEIEEDCVKSCLTVVVDELEWVLEK